MTMMPARILAAFLPRRCLILMGVIYAGMVMPTDASEARP
jgi:hypothetical protein